MRENTEHRDVELIDLGAATELTQGDPQLKQREQLVITDHWDAP